jgi:hypothetical protein
METKNDYNKAYIGMPKKGNYKRYQNDRIFQSIEEIKEFYDFLSTNDDSITVAVAKGPINYNTDIFSSLFNTLDSIQQLLRLGRINDAFSLIRKYNDAVIIQIYALIVSENEERLFSEESHSLYDNIVNEWVNGKACLIEKGDYDSKEEAYLSVIKGKDVALNRLLFNKRTRVAYGQKRGIGDDNLHYNNWNTFRFNNPQIMDYPISLSLLSEAYDAIRLLFVIHFSYLILLKPMAMLSCDYIYALEEGLTPDEETKNYAASIFCEMFEKYIGTFDKELADHLCDCNFLQFRY